MVGYCFTMLRLEKVRWQSIWTSAYIPTIAGMAGSIEIVSINEFPFAARLRALKPDSTCWWAPGPKNRLSQQDAFTLRKYLQTFSQAGLTRYRFLGGLLTRPRSMGLIHSMNATVRS